MARRLIGAGPRGAVVLLAVWLAMAILLAQDEEPPVKKEPPDGAQFFFKDACGRYELHYKNELESFGVELRVLSLGRGPAGQLAGDVVINYEWETPALEDIALEGVPGRYDKMIRDPLRGLWKDIVGGGVFPELEGGALTLSVTDEGTALINKPDDSYERTVYFDPETKLVLSAKLVRDDSVSYIVPTYSSVDGIFRIESKIVTIDGTDGSETEGSFTYRGFQKLSDYFLPTQMTVNLGDSMVEFSIDYLHINGEKPAGAGVDPAVLKVLIQEFEKQYSTLSTPEKLAGARKLAATRDEKAAETIARKVLKDKEIKVRQEGARILGHMGCRKAVPHLIKAMKANEKELTVYEALINALGDLGDPRAVPALSGDFWNQKEGIVGLKVARIKIDALGQIRSKTSVEALMGLLYKGEPGVMNRLAPSLVKSLQGLTGQEIGWDRSRWKDWWKKNKGRIKLDEDR